MKDGVREILNELQTSDGIEVLKLTYDEIIDYRQDGYYVLVLKSAGKNGSSGLCYLSKDEDKLKKKMNKMKRPDDYFIMSKLRKA